MQKSLHTQWILLQLFCLPSPQHDPHSWHCTSACPAYFTYPSPSCFKWIYFLAQNKWWGGFSAERQDIWSLQYYPFNETWDITFLIWIPLLTPIIVVRVATNSILFFWLNHLFLIGRSLKKQLSHMLTLTNMQICILNASPSKSVENLKLIQRNRLAELVQYMA